MLNPFRITAHAFRLWWDEWVVMLLLNVLWFLLQVPVVTSAPATATVYAMVQQSYEGAYWTPRMVWETFRRLFWPAWRWGLLNAVVWLVGLSNLSSYWHATGTIWFLLRLIWMAALFGWLALNLFYWPFWLAQAERSMRTTYANCLRFLLLHPGTALVLVLFSVVLALLSMATTLPLTLAFMCWLALLGVTAVQRSLSLQSNAEQS